MRFNEWEPVYEAILADFGFERRADEDARDLLLGITRPFDPDRFASLRGRTVGVAGGAPGLETELDRLESADVVVGASRAAAVLADAGVSVDYVVTDLDKVPERMVEFSYAGVPVVVLAHGDNTELVSTWVPKCDPEFVVATTQAAPHGHVVNFGGFTDGDRGVFLADSFGAEVFVFAGWEFDDDSVGGVKRRKLVWAERLLRWLEIRRDERFSILDGRRSEIDTSKLPV